MGIESDPFFRAEQIPTSDADPLVKNYQTGLSVGFQPQIGLTPNQQATSGSYGGPFGSPYIASQQAFESNSQAMLLSAPLGNVAGPGDNNTSFGLLARYTAYDQGSASRVIVDGRFYEVTTENWADIGRAKIAEREKKEDRKLSNDEITNLFNALQTLATTAGGSPISPHEAAAQNYKEIDNQIIVKMANGTSEAFSHATDFVRNAVSELPSFLKGLRQDAQLIVIAGIILGGVYIINKTGISK